MHQHNESEQIEPAAMSGSAQYPTRKVTGELETLQPRNIEIKPTLSGRLPKTRETNFTNSERALLIELLVPYKDVVESHRNDATIMAMKQEAWTAIRVQFNNHAKVTNKRSVRQLKKCWENLRDKARKSMVENDSQDVDYRPDTLGVIADTMARKIDEQSSIRQAVTNACVVAQTRSDDFIERSMGDEKITVSSFNLRDTLRNVDGNLNPSDALPTNIQSTAIRPTDGQLVDIVPAGVVPNAIPPSSANVAPISNREWRMNLRRLKSKQREIEMKCMRREHECRMRILRRQKDILLKLDEHLSTNLSHAKDIGIQLVGMCTPD